MNDDYLWDKSGADPETIRLEETLAVFRHRENDPPAIPIAVPTFVPRKRIALAYAMPALAVLTLAGGVWLGTVRSGEEQQVTFVHHPPAAETTFPPPVPGKPTASPSTAPAHPSVPAPRKVVPMVASAPRRARSNERSPKAMPVATLTNEERHAYEQLMLALAISSSKIKIVHNAINGVEEIETVPIPNNR